MKNLISISGRIGAGKDLVGTIIQYLIWKNKVEKNETGLANYKLEDFQRLGNTLTDWKIKKFADKLKDIVCILLGCSRADLENRQFKEKELGEEWNKYEVSYRTFDRLSQDPYGEWYTEYYSTLKEAELCTRGNLELDEKSKTIKLIKLTPRLMMQLIGTECFRNIIHPNTWVNALFSEYKCPICSSVPDRICFGHSNPNWILSDTRFLNELEAVKSRGGITIKVARTIDLRLPDLWNLYLQLSLEKVYNENLFKDWLNFYDNELYKKYYHESETALDSAQFDYILENNGSVEELIEKVKAILIKEGII